MKKILILACAIVLGSATQAAVTWDWWFGHSSDDISGCALGLGAANAKVVGAQVALCAAKAENVEAGAQVAIGYSQVDTLRNGAQGRLKDKKLNKAFEPLPKSAPAYGSR